MYTHSEFSEGLSRKDFRYHRISAGYDPFGYPQSGSLAEGAEGLLGLLLLGGRVSYIVGWLTLKHTWAGLVGGAHWLAGRWSGQVRAIVPSQPAGDARYSTWRTRS